MKDYTKGVLTGVITTALLSGVGYVYVIRELAVKVDYNNQALQKVSANVETQRKDTGNLKLFVVAAHPDRDFASLNAAAKVEDMSPNDLDTLAKAIVASSSNGSIDWQAFEERPEVPVLVKRYALDRQDVLDLHTALLPGGPIPPEDTPTPSERR